MSQILVQAERSRIGGQQTPLRQPVASRDPFRRLSGIHIHLRLGITHHLPLHQQAGVGVGQLDQQGLSYPQLRGGACRRDTHLEGVLPVMAFHDDLQPPLQLVGQPFGDHRARRHHSPARDASPGISRQMVQQRLAPYLQQAVRLTVGGRGGQSCQATSGSTTPGHGGRRVGINYPASSHHHPPPRLSEDEPVSHHQPEGLCRLKVGKHRARSPLQRCEPDRPGAASYV